MRRVKFRVGVGRVSVPAPPAAEHHGAALHRAPVHLPQVDRAEVDLESPLVTERLHADLALNPLLTGGGTHVGNAEILWHRGNFSILIVRLQCIHRAPPAARVAAHIRKFLLASFLWPGQVESPSEMVLPTFFGLIACHGPGQSGKWEYGEMV